MSIDRTGIYVTSSADRKLIGGRSTRLRGVDGRSAEARRFRELVNGFAAEFGTAPPGEREIALCRQAAGIALRAESVQAQIARGDQVDTDDLVRLTNALTRTLTALGIKNGRAVPKGPTLKEYIAAKQAEAAQ